MGKNKYICHTCYDCCYKYDTADIPGAVFFFKEWSDNKYQHYISHKMREVGMSEDVAEKTHIGKRTEHRGFIDTEHEVIGFAACDIAEDKCHKTYTGKSDYYGGIEGNLQF